MATCPHCRVDYHAQFTDRIVTRDAEGGWGLRVDHCPTCKRAIVMFGPGVIHDGANYSEIQLNEPGLRFIRPRSSTRRAPHPDVPAHIAEDFTEAALVLPDSPKASAALSRRCLQALLQEAAGATEPTLAKLIDAVLGSKALPTYLSEPLDHVRQVGNYAAHPVKSKSTGEVVPVEPGEAEFNLDVLEGLFDFYYVEPAKMKAKLDATNKKLADMGKQPMKKPGP